MGLKMPGLVFDYPHEWYKFVSSRFQVRSVGLGFRPIFRQTQKTVRLIEQFFVADFVQRPEVGPHKWQGKEAFFARLDGEANFIRIGDPLRCAPLYNRTLRRVGLTAQPWSDGTWFNPDNTGWVEGGVPEYATLAQSAVRGGNWLVIGGLPASTTGLLSPGDLLEIRIDGIASTTSMLHQVVTLGHSDANGRSAVEVRPRLRKDVNAGDQVVFSYPKAVMQLVDSDQAALSRESNLGSFGFSCAEHTG